MMRVAIVVNRFPVLSESFIVRLVESLLEKDQQVVVVALEGVDEGLLAQLSPAALDAMRLGRLELWHDGDFRATRPRLLIARLRWSMAALMRDPVGLFGYLRSGIGLKSAVGAATFRRIMKGRQVDVIHAQFMTVAASVVAGALRGCLSVPIVSFARGYDVTQNDALSSKALALLRGAGGLAAVTCVSASLAARVVALGFQKECVHVVHAGIPVARFAYQAPTAATSAGLKLVQVGRLVEKKGYDLSLRMLSLIQDSNVTLRIVGEGPLKAALLDAASSHGLLDRVSFLGAMSHDETLAVVRQADVMLIPSRVASDGDSEGIPNVLKEAMALGVLCVGSTHSGIPELLEDGVSGFLFEEGNVDAYVDSMRRAISHRSDWASIAATARKRVIDEFDSSSVALTLCDLYASAAPSRVVLKEGGESVSDAKRA